MVAIKTFLLSLSLGLLPLCSAGDADTASWGGGSTNYAQACRKIGLMLSRNSNVYYPGNAAYDAAIKHWSTASTQQSACVVEPATSQDVSTVLIYVGSFRVPFAVKGGGHGTLPEGSSTPGVHISMAKFNEVRYNAAKQTAEVGAGLVWDQVYAALQPHNVTVVGGRASGVGVAGLILGGGYSWLTNQYGLAIDNVEAFELVRPTGIVSTVTQRSDPELFNGLKGGMNNFGIVTKFTLKTYPQGQIWGGLIVFMQTEYAQVTDAVKQFATLADPKAGLIATYQAWLGYNLISLQVFYDGPQPPAGMFDTFLGLPSFLSDVGTRSLSELLVAGTGGESLVNRNFFHSASLSSFGDNVFNTVINETIFWNQNLPPPAEARFLSFSIEPYMPDIYSHNTANTAFPFKRSPLFSPLNVFYGWTNAADDAFYISKLKDSVRRIEEAAIADGDTGVTTAPIYPNNALHDTPLERLYGTRLPGLRQLRRRVDPFNVMSLTGGFRV